jgi:hypothetical protein
MSYWLIFKRSLRARKHFSIFIPSLAFSMGVGMGRGGLMRHLVNRSFHKGNYKCLEY